MTGIAEWQTLLEVVSRLNNSKTDYMLTGSFAKTIYATPRMTRDIDIVVELNEKDISRFVSAFASDFYIDPESAYAAVNNQRMFNIIHNTQFVKVDLIIRKSDLFHAQEFERRRKHDVNGLAVWIVSPEDLILSKLLWAKDSLSEVQLSDVRDLCHSVKDLDTGYIETQVQSLGLSSLYAMVKKS